MRARPHPGFLVSAWILLAAAAARDASGGGSGALDAFRDAKGAAWELRTNGTELPSRTLLGGAIDWSPATQGGHLSPHDVESRALSFAREHEDLLGLRDVQLRGAGGAASADGSLRVVHLEQAHGGVPVAGARVSFVLVGGRLLHVQATGTRAVTIDPVPALSEPDAVATALAAAPGSTERRTELFVLPEGAGHRLAWRVELRGTGHRPRRPVAWIDARDGALLSLTDEAREACDPPPPGGLERRVLGGVRPERADEDERLELLPLAEVAGSPAGADGFFAPPPAPYAARLSGPAASVSCASCSNPRSIEAPASSSGDVSFGTGGEDALGNGSSTPADRSAYFHVEGARRLASRWLSLPFLQRPVPIVTNSPLSCNAYWDGTALTFFRSSQRCGNTGEIRDVIVHEYGHALDEHDGTPPPGVAVDAATGEAIADILAMLRSRDACIGESFFADPRDWPSNDCSGVRDLDESAPGHRRGTLDSASIASHCPQSTNYRGILGYQGHCEGELLGQAAWHLFENLRTGLSLTDGSPLPTGALGEEAAWELLERLFFRALPLIASQAPSSQQSLGLSAHDAFLLADDEGDGLANGTPHAAAIHDAFAHHGLAESPTAPPDGSPCSAPADPALTITEGLDAASGLPFVRVDWRDTGGAVHHLLRADGPGEGYLPVAPAFGPGAGSFTDRGVLAGRSYRYRVVAETADGCGSPGASPALAGTGPRVEAVALVVDDSAGGDGDGRLARGESAALSFELVNRGGSPASNLLVGLAAAEAQLTVLDPGPLAYGTLAPGASAPAPGAFTLQAGASAPRFVTLTLEGEADEGCQRSEWLLEIAQPDLLLEGERLDDTAGGDGDGSWQPGEQVELALLLRNDGLLPANAVSGTLSLRAGAPAGVSLVRASAAWPDLAAGAQDWTAAPAFALAADPGVSPRERVPLRLEIEIGGAPHRGVDFELELGGLPPGALEWSHGPALDHTVNPIVVQLDDDDGDGAVTDCDVPDVLVRTGWGAGAALRALEGDGSGELWTLFDPCFDMGAGSQLAAGDVDRDGENEIVVMDRTGITCAISAAGTVKWRSAVVAQASQVAGDTSRSAAPQLRDLDGDGRVEVIVGYTVLDGADGSLIWEKHVNNRGQVLVVDLDLDGSEELLGGVEEQFPVPADSRAWRADGRPFGVVFEGLTWGAAAADLDGDPQAEVVWVDKDTGLNAANPDGSEVFPRWEAAPLTQIIGTYQPCLADFDGDGLAEVGAPVQDRLVVLDGDGTELWSRATDGDWFSGCSAFDFDLDGRPELVHHDLQQLRVHDGADGSVRWETFSPMPYDLWQAPTIADVDGDGAAEILVIGGAGVFEGELQVYGSSYWPAARRTWNQQQYSVSHVEQDGTIPSPAPPWWSANNGFRLQSGACACDEPPPDFSLSVACGTSVACVDAGAGSGSGSGSGDAVSWEWDFGDGSPTVSGESACHEYAVPGRYLVTLRALDAAGCLREATRLVDAAPPLALALVLPEACAGLEACLEATPSGGEGAAEVLWSFDDGSAAAGPSACFTRPAGPLRGVVRVVDETGCFVEESFELEVAAAPANVGAVLFATGHGDPRAPQAVADFDWSADLGAPRPAGVSYLLLRGTAPDALARVPGTEGLGASAFTDSTPAAGAARRPLVHYYRVLAERGCGLASVD